jgi:nicotinate-nucleotide adenylyltransferase
MTNTRLRKIGLFGGTFNPIHTGHLIIAEVIRQALQIDQILFIPAKIHAFKNNQQIQSSRHRLRMLELVIRDNPYFLISELELNKEGISYTIDTIKMLRLQYPEDRYTLYFLMGADNVAQFHKWKEPAELVKLCNFVVFGRPGFEVDPKSDPLVSKFQFVEAPLLEISSTDIRNRIQGNISIRYMVPPQVEAYIHQHSLYKNISNLR